MSIVFQLPNDISVSILSQWCDLKDLVSLDSAYCTEIERSILLHTFKSHGFVLLSTVTLPMFGFLAAKGISVMSLHIAKTEFIKDIHNSALLVKMENFSKVKNIEISIPYDKYSTFQIWLFTSMLVNKCESLTRMHVKNLRYGGDFFTSLNPSILGNIIDLKCDIEIFGSEAYRYLAQHCHSLVSIDISCDEAGAPESDITALLASNPKLTSICLAHRFRDNVSHKTIHYIMNQFPKIKVLKLGIYFNISLAMVIEVLTKCVHCDEWRFVSHCVNSGLNCYREKNGRSISIHQGVALNAQEWVQLFALVKDCKSFLWNHWLSQDCDILQSLEIYKTTLDTLYILDCAWTTTADVLKLLKACPNLTSITIDKCPLVDNHDIGAFLKARRALRV